jgi:hypothetical protein
MQGKPVSYARALAEFKKMLEFSELISKLFRLHSPRIRPTVLFRTMKGLV